MYDAAGEPRRPIAVAVTLGDAHDTSIGGSRPRRRQRHRGQHEGVDQGTGTTSVDDPATGTSSASAPTGTTSVPNGSVERAPRRQRQSASVPFVENGDVRAGGHRPRARRLAREPHRQHLRLAATARRSPRRRSMSAPAADNAFIGIERRRSSSTVCIPLVDLLQHHRRHRERCARHLDRRRERRADLAQRDRRSVSRRRSPARRSASAAAPSAPTSATTTTTPTAATACAASTGPPIEVDGGASKIVIGGQRGSRGQRRSACPTGLFTDLLPDARARQHRHREQRHPAARPSRCRASTGVGGTGIPGATHPRPAPAAARRSSVDPDPSPEGSTFPPDAVHHHGRRRRHLGRRVPDAAEDRREAPRLADRPPTASSEYASPAGRLREQPAARSSPSRAGRPASSTRGRRPSPSRPTGRHRA